MKISPGLFRSGAAMPLVGCLQLILAQSALSALDASGKWIMASAGVSLLVLCWFRYLIHLGIAVAVLVPARGRQVFHSRKPRNQLLRGTFMLLATFTIFTTLRYLPQAEATAITFLAPLLVLALAPALLRERPRRSRWVAALTGFAGVLIVIRPGAGLDPIGTLFGLLTACLFAGQHMATRLVAIDDPMTSLIWSGATGSAVMTVLLLFAWPLIQPAMSALSPLQWLILLSTGFWGALGHLLQIQAYRNAPASLLSPILYMQIVSATALGWFIWGDFPDALTWVGIAIVVASGISIGLYEWRHQEAAGSHAKALDTRTLATQDPEV